MTSQEHEMRAVFAEHRSAGLSQAMSAQAARDYGYSRSWIVASSFVTELRRENPLTYCTGRVY